MTWNTNSIYSYSYRLLIIVASAINATAIVSVDKCGSLSIEQPTILGRNVTFTFTPSLYDVDATLLWQRTNKRNPWADLKKNKFIQFEEDGKFYLILTNTVSTKRKDDAVFYRIQYYNESVNCTMETEKLVLHDISREACGFVFLRTAKIEVGKKVEIEYYPKKTAKDNSRQWVRSTNENKTLPSNLDGVYEETSATNDKYLFTIFSFNASINGRYGVLCDNVGYSNFIEVNLSVPPSQPTFEGLKDIEKCKNCIVGEAGDTLSVSCKTNGGTEPVTVTLEIENGKISTFQRRQNDGVSGQLRLHNRHHMALVKCSVMNVALESPLTVTAPIYVIKPPTFESFNIPGRLKEGDSVNITCQFDAGRPAPTLSLYLSDKPLTPTDQTNTFNVTDQSFSSVLTLTTFNKKWNDQIISCCRYSHWYKTKTECSNQKRVRYLFPPSGLKLEIVTEGNDPTEVYAICTIYNSNPVCKAKWQAPNGSIHSERNSRNESKPHGAWDSEYKVTVNMSKPYTGEKIVCTPNCTDFTVNMEQSFFLPYASDITFNLPSSVLTITKGDQTDITCTARSSPSSNISWVERGEGGAIELKQCNLETDCLVTIRGDRVAQRSLFCRAQHLLGSGTRNLTIDVIEKQTESNSVDTSLSWILIGGVVGVIAIVVTVCLIVKIKRKDTKGKLTHSQEVYSMREDRTRHSDANVETAQGNVNDAEQATAQPGVGRYCEASSAASNATPCDDAVYSVVNKTSNATPCDDAVYSVVNKTSKAKDPPSQKNNQIEGGQLVYADLALDPPGSQPLQQRKVERLDTVVEYVGIDFVKTEELQKRGSGPN